MRRGGCDEIARVEREKGHVTSSNEDNKHHDIIELVRVCLPPDSDGDPFWIALMTAALPWGDMRANTLMYSAALHRGEESPPLTDTEKRR